ncbi:MAG: molybdopterin molybdotransferase MoeA [Burkholderiales bacterium]|nr:molybdopterin molybdotransferase MoeA [Burkholderiales bacterium]
MSTQNSPSLFSDTASVHPTDLTVETAQRIMRELVSPFQETETATLHSALDRVLAEDIVSTINVPAYDNAAMDGYAFHGADLVRGKDLKLKIVGSAFAGHSFDGAVQRGECISIMTGAMMPRECDTVVPHELVQKVPDYEITIPAGAIEPRDNRRFKGEDLAIGQVALTKGKFLRPADLGLLASLGVANVPVLRKLRVAFFSTGDELRSVGEPLDPGCIYDSNRYTVFGMLARLGCDLIDMGVVKDDPAALEHALRNACEQADAIITSGGVSVGAADYTGKILQQLGEVAFWKIAMRPGKPLAFGRISSHEESALLFGLPGNPVAAMVSFYFFVRPALLKMMGSDADGLPLMRATSQSTMRKKPGRTEFQRGILSNDARGNPQVRITGAQGSGILHSMSQANCIVVLPHDGGNINVGDQVDVVLFDGLI